LHKVNDKVKKSIQFALSLFHTAQVLLIVTECVGHLILESSNLQVNSCPDPHSQLNSLELGLGFGQGLNKLLGLFGVRAWHWVRLAHINHTLAHRLNQIHVHELFEVSVATSLRLGLVV